MCGADESGCLSDSLRRYGLIFIEWPPAPMVVPEGVDDSGLSNESRPACMRYSGERKEMLDAECPRW